MLTCLIIRKSERKICQLSDNLLTSTWLILRRSCTVVNNSHLIYMMQLLISTWLYISKRKFKQKHGLLDESFTWENGLDCRRVAVIGNFQTKPSVFVFRPRIHDDLLYAVIMYKEFTMDKRIEYVTALIDMVDRERTRHHLVLPLLTRYRLESCCLDVIGQTIIWHPQKFSTEDIEERLKIIFRCTNIGYKDLSQLDILVLSHLVLQPLYGKMLTISLQALQYFVLQIDNGWLAENSRNWTK